MGARITGNATGVLTSSVKPKVSVSVVFAVADTSYALADATVYYVRPVLSAYLDTTGRFKFVMDVYSVDDSATLDVTKNLTDSFGLGDDAVLGVAKDLSDSIGLTETFVRTLVFIRDFDDSVAMSDDSTFEVEKALQDGFAFTEHTAFEVAKLLTDGVAMSDTSSAVDGSQYSFSKYITNIAFASDTITVQAQKGLSETVSGVDSGYLRGQGYCDFTYFAEDYVGYSRTF